ncbi:ATP-binding cassette domain-containing protein [Halalkalibacter krulwichiae]|uniref:ATP-binding cassette domain-containing protein n=1 Tax=Halalkalibacter krulwichiae TaxID=199441 RepID=UPI000AF42973|nr:ABC transporter ATP-binding protein [Halalkalibacter krulwichiae]
MIHGSSMSTRVDQAALLQIEQLELSYTDSKKKVPIVQNVSFEIHSGEIVALVGPSGCGKSMTAQAIVGLLDSGVQVTNGAIIYKKDNVCTYTNKQMKLLRRNEIALFIQHSLSGLNPIRTVKKQMVETLMNQKRWKKKEMEFYLHTLLQQVGFSDPKAILGSYPFELSGGMQQRVLLAMMVSLKPKLLIADEPTTALDVINRNRVLNLLKKIQQDHHLTVLLISHDQQSVKHIADRVIQMSAGGIVRESTSTMQCV